MNPSQALKKFFLSSPAKPACVDVARKQTHAPVPSGTADPPDVAEFDVAASATAEAGGAVGPGPLIQISPLSARNLCAARSPVAHAGARAAHHGQVGLRTAARVKYYSQGAHAKVVRGLA